MLTLALDVDGVLLDPDRHGRGPWTDELDRPNSVSMRSRCRRCSSDRAGATLSGADAR